MSLRTRIRVFDRDGHRCTYCGRSSRETVLEVDHKVPRSKGGSDDLDNLTTSCRDCNQGKGDVMLPATTATARDPRWCPIGQHEYGGEHTWYRRGRWHDEYVCRRCGVVPRAEMFPLPEQVAP